MTDKTREAIKGMMAGLGASRYKKAKPWKGYEVYEPVYQERVCIGLPIFVFVKGDEVRLADDEEAMEYLDYSTPPGEDD